MTNLERFLSLAGKNSKHELIETFKKDSIKIKTEYDNLLDQLKKEHISEFDLVTVLLDSINNLHKIQPTKSIEISKKSIQLEQRFKEFYRSNVQRPVLNGIFEEVIQLNHQLEQLHMEAAPLAVDKDLMNQFEQVKIFTTNLLISLVSRIAVAEKLENNPVEIEHMLQELNLSDEPAISLQEATLASGFLEQVKNTTEFKEASNRMKFMSTMAQAKNGILVFDTGIKAIAGDGKEAANTSILLKVYPDGQVRGELKGKVSQLDTENLRHYRLGKIIQGKTDIDMYSKALADVVKRYERKKVKMNQEKELVGKQYDAWQKTLVAANTGGADATLDDI